MGNTAFGNIAPLVRALLSVPNYGPGLGHKKKEKDIAAF